MNPPDWVGPWAMEVGFVCPDCGGQVVVGGVRLFSLNDAEARAIEVGELISMRHPCGAALGHWVQRVELDIPGG